MKIVEFSALFSKELLWTCTACETEGMFVYQNQDTFQEIVGMISVAHSNLHLHSEALRRKCPEGKEDYNVFLEDSDEFKNFIKKLTQDE